MPTSYYTQLNEIMELILLTEPKSILDIGVGFGKYVLLSREYLEYWGKTDLEYNNWKVKIYGIEAFKEYLTPVHDFIYDEIYVGDAIDILPNLEGNYDLILLIDILEHFHHEEWRKLLKECLKRGKNIIISTPKDIEFQRSSVNPYENHRCRLRKKDFNRFSNKFFVKNDNSIICYIGDDAQRVKKSSCKLWIKTKIIGRFPFLKRPYLLIRKWLKTTLN